MNNPEVVLTCKVSASPRRVQAAGIEDRVARVNLSHRIIPPMCFAFGVLALCGESLHRVREECWCVAVFPGGVFGFGVRVPLAAQHR